MIWVLGAGGYIGSHLLARFRHANQGVIGIDKHTEDIIGLANRHCEILTMDLSEETPVFNDGDIIYHLATMKHYPSESNREQAQKDIYGTTVNTVEKCKNRKILLVFTSSRTVYGKTEGETFEDSQLNPVTVYGKFKKECEELISEQIKEYAIIRLSNVYGGYRPFDKYMAVADKFMYDAIKQHPLIVEGGSQMYDFTFLDEVIDGLLNAMKSKARNYKTHFSTGKATSIMSLACQIKQVANSSSKISVTSPRDYEKERTLFWGNPDYCERILGLRFGVLLDKGLQIMYNRYMEYMHSDYSKYLLDSRVNSAPGF